jgi:DsbC/DsbD-like thiol-disulfide interchange protein
MVCDTGTRLTLATIAVIGVTGASSAALAQNSSAWQKELHASARLIAGAPVNSAEAKWLRAGIEIRLDPGWKTYWRNPGDSGVPPTLDFAGSANVKTVVALWPAPERFDDGSGGHSIGYVGNVVLPLRILPKDAAKAASLHVKLGYAICGRLCVPAETSLDLAVSDKTSAEEPALATAERRVPRRVALGADAGAGRNLAIRSVHRETSGTRQRVVVDVAAPDGVPVDLFVGGPTADWALPFPEPAAGDVPGLRRFAFDLDGLPPGAHAKDAKLTFTAVSPADAIEVEAHLD